MEVAGTAARAAISALTTPFGFFGPSPLTGFFRVIPVFAIFQDFFAPNLAIDPEELPRTAENIIKDFPLPFYGAMMAAGLTLAGLDPGMALRAFAELVDALTPGT